MRLAALVAVLVVLFGAVQQASPGLVGGDDGYYHVKMAWLMRGDLTPAFTWLPFTILSPSDFADHHWLFHVLLIPFMGGDLVLGGKLAAVVFAVAALLTAVPVLRRCGVPAPELWAILMFASSSAFVYRLSMPRAQSLSLLWLLLTVYVLLDGRHWRLVLVGVTYVWLYNGFPLMAAVVAMYLLVARAIEGSWRWRTLGYTSAGLVLGIVGNPYFPRNVVFLYHHLVAKLDRVTIAVGSEWAPYSTAQLVENCGIALVTLVAGVIALGWARERMDVPTALGLALCLMFGALLMVSRRFVEYLPAFAVLFSALAWRPLLRPFDVKRRHRFAALLVLTMVAALTMSQARAAVRGAPPEQHFAGASEWLITNTRKGDVVFQSDWDDFPRLFFHNTHNRYIVGLDPTYLHRADPIKYWLWVDLTQGRGRNLARSLVEEFGAGYAISDLRHGAFLARAEADPAMVQVYRDATSVVLKVAR